MHSLDEGSVRRAGHLVIHLQDHMAGHQVACRAVVTYLLCPLCYLVPCVHGLDPLMGLPVRDTVALTMSLYGCFKSRHKCCMEEALAVQDEGGCGSLPPMSGSARLMRSSGNTSGTPPTFVLTTCSLWQWREPIFQL